MPDNVDRMVTCMSVVHVSRMYAGGVYFSHFPSHRDFLVNKSGTWPPPATGRRCRPAVSPTALTGRAARQASPNPYGFRACRLRSEGEGHGPLAAGYCRRRLSLFVTRATNAEDAPAFAVSGVFILSGYRWLSPVRPLARRAACSTAARVTARVKCTPPAAPLRSPVRRCSLALCRERSRREMN